MRRPQPSATNIAPMELGSAVRSPSLAYAATLRDVEGFAPHPPARSLRPSTHGESPAASSRQASLRGAPTQSRASGRGSTSANNSWEMPTTPSVRSGPTAFSPDTPPPALRAANSQSEYLEPLSYFGKHEDPGQVLARRRRIAQPVWEMETDDEGIRPSHQERITVSFTMEDYRGFASNEHGVRTSPTNWT